MSEVCALRYEDLEEIWIHVRRSSNIDGSINEYAKGYKERYVLFSVFAKAIVDVVKQYQERMGYPSNGYIFSVNDKPILYSAVTKAFYKYCRKIGIPPKSSHKARKSFGTLLHDESDISADTISRMLGHEDVEVFYNNYYFDRRSDRDNYNKMNKAFEGLFEGVFEELGIMYPSVPNSKTL